MSKRVSCINKKDRYDPAQRISHLGGGTGSNRWKLSQREVVRQIDQGIETFEVEINEGVVKIVVRVSQYGNKYVKTEADGETENNLLNLPECR